MLQPGKRYVIITGVVLDATLSVFAVYYNKTTGYQS